MDLEDMIMLISIYDGVEEVGKSLKILCGSFSEEGAPEKLSWITEIIQKHSPVWNPDYEGIWEETELASILDSGESAEVRAKKLLKMK